MPSGQSGGQKVTTNVIKLYRSIEHHKPMGGFTHHIILIKYGEYIQSSLGHCEWNQILM